MGYQLGLFGWQKPKAKIPVSAERIRELKELIEKKGDGKTAAQKMRDFRENLENIERRITNAKNYD